MRLFNADACCNLYLSRKIESLFSDLNLFWSHSWRWQLLSVSDCETLDGPRHLVYFGFKFDKFMNKNFSNKVSCDSDHFDL